MTRTLLLHIGHYKTGTTAIQTFCQQNRVHLQNAGLNYAQTHLKNAKHSALAFAIGPAGADTLMHGYKKPESPREIWGRLLEEVRRAPQPTTLVSSEELMRIAEFPAAWRPRGDPARGPGHFRAGLGLAARPVRISTLV